MSLRAPKFPTPPIKNINPSRLTMPGDLIANGRNFYTEINFLDFRSARFGAGFSSILNQAFTSGGISGAVGAGFTALGVPSIISSTVSTGVSALVGGPLGPLLDNTLFNSGGAESSNTVRLPIPRAINDIITLNWQEVSYTQAIAQVTPVLSAALAVGTLGLAPLGKAINPFLFLAFNHQNFREFTFEWVLAPVNKKESQIIKDIVKTFKNSSLPTSGPIMDYPLIANVKMFPNDLNQHMKFKPMAVQSVSVNYTPNPTGPAFFGNELVNTRGGQVIRSDGAPTMVTLAVKFKEIELWSRGDPDI